MPQPSPNFLVRHFSIYHNGILIGYSALEHGDPPMGVAFGQFLPLPIYQQLQAQTHTMLTSDTLNLCVKTPDNQRIECLGISIVDYSADMDEGGREITLIGIPHPLYTTLFPEHVEEYGRIT